MTAPFWKLGLTNLLRDLRSGELRLLIVAVALAVAALTAVGFFADRLQGGLARDARQLLGGDAVIATDHAPPKNLSEEAATLGLEHVTTLAFPTMARANDAQGGAARLVALKAVEPGYPLRGTMRVAPGPDEAAAPTRDVPAPGQAWVDPGVLGALNLKVGDHLLLGDSSLRITRTISIEPDRGVGFMSFSPRVMINRADLPATGLVQPASRIGWRFAVAGEQNAVARFVAWARAETKKPEVRGLRVETLETGRPAMRQTLDRADKFLNLVALLSALLSAVAVALTARAFAANHLDQCAMLRVLGVGQRKIALAYGFEFALVGVAASLIGVAIGFVVHYGFVLLLSGLVAAGLPAPGWWPVAFGLGVGLTLLFAFGLPPVLQLAQVPPIRVIRREVGNLRPASLAVLGVGVVGFALLLLAASRDLKLGLIAVGGFAGAVALFAGLSFIAVKLLRRSVNESSAPRWLVLATRQISARPGYAVVQVSALAVGLLALVLLVLLRTDLISSWRQATPPDAPNRFVINVMPEQGKAFRAAIESAGIKKYDWYPMIRGRLVEVNGKPALANPNATNDVDSSEGRGNAPRSLNRELNLSFAAEQPPHNQIVAGQWTGEQQGTVSVEDGLAENLGLKLGDQLRFDVGGLKVDARITSLRKVDWGSLRANFYMIFPVSRMEGVPTTYMSAFRVPDGPVDALGNGDAAASTGAQFDNALVREFPNITSINMKATIDQVQRVLDQVIRAVEFLFGFTLAAGLVVLFAAISATREERTREFAIMRAIGARAALLRQVQRAELAGVGLLAGFLASIVASIVGWALARWVFEFAWTASPLVPLVGALCGAVLALAAGWWGLREVLNRPVVDTLRRAAE